MMRKQAFKIHAMVVGRGLWSCPYCGHSHALHLSPKSRWRIECGNPECQSVFRVGIVLHPLGPGQGRTGRPPDTVMGESIPESKLAPKPYRKGMPVHEVSQSCDHQWGPIVDATAQGVACYRECEVCQERKTVRHPALEGAEDPIAPGFVEGLVAGTSEKRSSV